MQTAINRVDIKFRFALLIVLFSLFVFITAARIVWLQSHQQESVAQISILKAKIPSGMALIPAGEAWIGSNDLDADDEVKPMRRIFLSSYYIDKHEVTNSEYRKFDPARKYPAEEANLPANNITYDEAAAYAKWAGKRLPRENEWEKAARGIDGRKYPWGNVWEKSFVAQKRPAKPLKSGMKQIFEEKLSDLKVCSLGPSRLRTVGSVPAGLSPYGCYDMAGNAWEWVQGYFNGNPQQRILRGGAVGYGERSCRTYTRSVEGSGST